MGTRFNKSHTQFYGHNLYYAVLHDRLQGKTYRQLKNRYQLTNTSEATRIVKNTLNYLIEENAGLKEIVLLIIRNTIEERQKLNTPKTKQGE